MGFISFNLDFYKNELHKLETATVSDEMIYRAKQLLKMLDDLLDEGYTELNNKLEEAYSGVSSLRAYLKHNHIEPFPIYRMPFSKTDITYDQTAYELSQAIKELVECAQKSADICADVFLSELIDFCKWIGYKDDTAYIFLLRDTLAPYIYYQSKNRKNIYPWLLGRTTLTKLTGTENADDEIRSVIINALEYGQCDNYKDFCDMVLPDIRSALKRHPEIEKRLITLLGGIKEKHIIVVESGCSGTFPMLLMSLDDRVDLRMYTTYPYLLKIYGDKIYSSKYENNRLFETLYSQDLYFRFSDLRNGKFYVEKCNNKEIEKYAITEIKTILDKSENDTCQDDKNIKIRYVRDDDKEFWFSLDKHISEIEFNKKVRDKQGYVLLANNLPVGILRYNLFWDNTPFCTMLYIAERYQGNGYGKKLMSFWENEMLSLGYDWILVSTQSDESAQHFYRALGYQDCGNLLAPNQPIELFLSKSLKN